jgi:hypothetical protein
MRGEQRGHLVQELGIAAAGGIDEGAALGPGPLQRRLEQVLDALPALGIHAYPASSRPSQARR